ncbi:phage portal protein, partial [Acinetobacter baumannii]|nr:phage portal protein [Acinetobacter baumannii]
VEIAEPTPNILGIVPVSVAKVSDEGYKDTIYSDIKYLVDAYEQCQSDICNEIADTRTAYLVASGCTLGDEQNITEMKSKGILELP